MSLFKKCNHDWQIVIEKFIDSNVERAMKNLNTGAKLGYLPTDLQGTHVIILKCVLCGDLDKTITKT